MVSYLSYAGSAVEKIVALHFLAGCRKRLLNQALSVLSFSLGFLSVSVVLLTGATFCVFCLLVVLVPEWALPRSRDPISKFWDLLITFELKELYA